MAQWILVLAAASLVDVMPPLAAEWSKASGVQVVFSFDASSRLAKQAESGAPADAVITADLDWMGYLENSGTVAPRARVMLAGNRLVAIAPSKSSLPTSEAAGLAAAEVKRLALAGESVPAGRYAQQALAALGVYEDVHARVVRGDTVRTVLRWVAEGEADAGVVYASDAVAEPRVRALFFFPQGSHAPIVYPGAVLKHARRPRPAKDFLDFCASKPARARWLKAGFLPAPRL